MVEHPDSERLHAIVDELMDQVARGVPAPEATGDYFDLASALEIATERAEAMLEELTPITGPFVEPTRELFINAFVAVCLDGLTVGARFERLHGPTDVQLDRLGSITPGESELRRD